MLQRRKAGDLYDALEILETLSSDCLGDGEGFWIIIRAAAHLGSQLPGHRPKFLVSTMKSRVASRKELERVWG